ncbi:MAG TPA: serine/threonine protein kinase [Blastocatellia bacterium]|nr:serine/threonine protein kinase [Blastocatellia bacterium]
MYYTIYGLNVHSSMPIPGIPALPHTVEADVRVSFQSTPRLDEGSTAQAEDWYTSCDRGRENEPALKVWKLGDSGCFRLRYCDGTEFFLSESGDEIWATWPVNMSLEDTATYLLGPIFGFLLRLRGVTCLHASAIGVDGRAIALIGPAGAGKSTTAAAFTRQGYPALSEDVVALRDQGDSFLVEPGYPLIRLWAESVEALFGSRDALPPLTPTWDKQYLDLTRNDFGFQRQPLPLAALYLLDGRSDDPAAPFVEAVHSQTGLVELVSNTYTNYMLDQRMRAREFDLLGRLINNTPLRRLKPHSDPARLPDLCRVILDDFHNMPAYGQI